MRQLKGVISHHESEVAELRADRDLAVEYLKAAMESLDDPGSRAARSAHGGRGVWRAWRGRSRGGDQS